MGLKWGNAKLPHISSVDTLSHLKIESHLNSQLCRDGLERYHCAEHITIWGSYILGTAVLFWVSCNVHGSSEIFTL